MTEPAELFKSLRPEEVCAYLESTGWRLVSENRLWRSYRHSEAPAYSPVVWVPMRTYYADYPVCVARCLDAVAEIEQRPTRAALVAGDLYERRGR